MDMLAYINKLQTNVFAIRNDDDLADRLNYRYTVAILVMFAIIVSHRQFSESVIKCWVPAFFTPNYETYANQVCWISNTYYVNSTVNIPKGEETRKSSEIKYYQWIPFILLIQALFLYIPRILWRLLSARAGLDVRDIIEAAHSYKSVDKYTNKSKIMEYIVQNIDQYASNPRRSKARDSVFQKIKYFSESLFCGSGIYLGNYLVTTYFFIKFVYLINSIGQFFIMNEFLGKQFHELGLDILRYLTNTYDRENYIESVYFPKVVMCDFRIREFGHPNFSHRYTIQCVLPINLYNQQIFTFLWFWFLILFCANLCALCQWINRMLPTSRRRYVNRRLNMLDYFKELNERTSIIKRRGLFGGVKKISYEAKIQKRRFIDEYLKFDGVFILRMISSLTSEIVCKEVLHELWTKRAVCKHDRSSSNEDFYRPAGPPRNAKIMPPNERNYQRPHDSFSGGDNTAPPVTNISPGLYSNRQPSPQIAEYLYPKVSSPVMMNEPNNSAQYQSQLEIDKQMLAAQKKAQQRVRQQSIDSYGIGKPRPQLIRSRASNVDTSTMSLNIKPETKVANSGRVQLSKISSQPHLYSTAKYAPSQMGRPKMARIQSFDSNLTSTIPPAINVTHSGGMPPKPKRVAFVTTPKEEEDQEYKNESENEEQNVEEEPGNQNIEEEDEEEESKEENKETNKNDLFHDLKARFD